MSMTALLNGTRKYLISQTNDVRELRVGVHPDGRPDPKMGTNYVSAFPVSKSAVPTRNASAKKEETFTIGLTLTVKFNAPRDRQGRVMTLEDVGICDLAERFEDIVHGSYELLIEANSYLADGGQNGPFCEPLLWTGTRFELKDNSWVWSTIETTAPVIYVAEMSFAGGKRVRSRG